MGLKGFLKKKMNASRPSEQVVQRDCRSEKKYHLLLVSIVGLSFYDWSVPCRLKVKVVRKSSVHCNRSGTWPRHCVTLLHSWS